MKKKEKKKAATGVKSKELPTTLLLAPTFCDLQHGFCSLFVYCDVVELVVVSIIKAPLPRTVNITDKEGLIVNRIFQTVQYVLVHESSLALLKLI